MIHTTLGRSAADATAVPNTSTTITHNTTEATFRLSTRIDEEFDFVRNTCSMTGFSESSAISEGQGSTCNTLSGGLGDSRSNASIAARFVPIATLAFRGYEADATAQVEFANHL